MAAKRLIESVSVAISAAAVRRQWTAGERYLRARAARRAFLRLIDQTTGGATGPEIWAVGSPSQEDVRRLAGERS